MVDWLENVIKSKVEQTTWDGYRNNVEKHIAPYFRARQMMLSDVKTADLEEYFNTKYKQGLSACYLKKHHANIKKALDGAVKNELIYKNPALLVELPKVKKYRACHYSVEQLETLLAATKGTSIESAVFITVHYGFRRGEALGLRWKDIDFNEKTLTICNQRTRVSRAVEKEPKSETSLRTLTLIPLVADYLKELKGSKKKIKNSLETATWTPTMYAAMQMANRQTSTH
jgi:site-specific recombinase XerD